MRHRGEGHQPLQVALQLHENTVAYRLRQITDALGVDGPAALVRADILMALRYRELER